MAFRELEIPSSGGAFDAGALALAAPAAKAAPAVQEAADDLAREVYCLLGIPVDAIDMAEALRRIDAAVAARRPFLISTPNLNFLITSGRDRPFRNSLLASDLCPVDGMPLVWIARLIGVPQPQRVSGSDMFEALKSGANELRVFLFGGPEGIAARAGEKLNAGSGRMRCVGSYYPGFSAVEDMASDATLDAINASGADFLAAALGAIKGQAWLLLNHDRLRIPVRVHLGAVLNFEAGSVARAPRAWRKLGFEWLWRIKEEPYLWRRYWSDGRALAALTVTRLLPLVALRVWRQFKPPAPLAARCVSRPGSVLLTLAGDATSSAIAGATAACREALVADQPVVIDVAAVRLVDARFLGLLLMLRKTLVQRGLSLHFTGLTRSFETYLRLSGLDFLLDKEVEAIHVAAIPDDCKA